MKLIVGLGNPESKYTGTRHNLGFEVLDQLGRKFNLVDWSLEEKFKSEIIIATQKTPPSYGGDECCDYSLPRKDRWSSKMGFSAALVNLLRKPRTLSPRKFIKSDQLILVKPQTFVNKSGLAVKLLTTYYKLSTTDVIVIHDELDLPLGKIKVRMGGAGAGHHGVESVINELGTDQFIRIRLGIGNLKSHSGEHKRIAFNAEKFVLEPFMPQEKAQVKHMIKQSIKALELILEKGIDKAQNQYN